MDDELDPWLYGNPVSDPVDAGLLGDPYIAFDPLNEHKGVGGGQGDNSYSSVGVDPSTLSDPTKVTPWQTLLNNLSKLGSSAGNFASSPQGIMAILAALAAYADRQKPSGGGTTMAYQGPKQYTRTVAPGAGGTPIARYAANGGLMQAYAGGGHVQMEDGGFVMTKRAVDGAGGPQGIQQLVPGARMIRGPGHGTSDSIPAVINGRNGQTPARLSNGEAYVPRDAVQQAGGPKRMYALMNSLQRKA